MTGCEGLSFPDPDPALGRRERPATLVASGRVGEANQRY